MKEYTTLDAIGDMFVIYLIVIVISMMVAAIIRGIVIVLSRKADQEKAKAPAAKPTPASVPVVVTDGIPLEHVAVIAAAVRMLFGGHRIVRIETPERHGWLAEARTVHHTSHAPRASR